MRFLQICVFALCATVLSGCQSIGITDYLDRFVYRDNVTQGNLITQEMAQALSVGMSREQVQFLLGEPLVKSQFHLNRWDYPYYFNPLRGQTERRTVTLRFDDQGRVCSISHKALPSERQADQQILQSQKKK